MLSPGQRQTGMPAVDLPDRLSNSINSKCQHLTPFYASVNTFSILPKSPLMARQLHQVSQHNIYSDRDENDEQFMQILPWIVKKLQALIKMGALLQPAWLASSWSSHPHLQVMVMVMNGGENKLIQGSLLCPREGQFVPANTARHTYRIRAV